MKEITSFDRRQEHVPYSRTTGSLSAGLPVAKAFVNSQGFKVSWRSVSESVLHKIMLNGFLSAADYETDSGLSYVVRSLTAVKGN